MKKSIILSALFFIIIGIILIVMFTPKPLGIPETVDFSKGLEKIYTNCGHGVKPSIIIHHTVNTNYTSLLHFSDSDKERLQSPSGNRMIINGKDYDYFGGYNYLIYPYNNKIQTLQVAPIGSFTPNSGDFCENLSSISIAFVANFSEREPIKQEYEAVNALIEDYPQYKVLLHRDIKATECPGKMFDSAKLLRYDGRKQVIQSVKIDKKPGQQSKKFNISGYYTPTLNQSFYLHNPHGGWGKWSPEAKVSAEQARVVYEALKKYNQIADEFHRYLGKNLPVYTSEKQYNHLLAFAQDFQVNCQGDCLITANGKHLDNSMANKVVACPPEYAFNTSFTWQGKNRWCVDRGGAIKTNRLDVWLGVGDVGINNFAEMGSSRGEQSVIIQ